MPESTENSPRARAVRTIERRRRFQAHVAFQALLVAVLAIVWAVSEYHNAGGWPTGFRTGRQAQDWDPWIVYPALVAVTAVGIHAWHLFGRKEITESDIRRELARCDR
jgi:hypothetical protein